MDYYQILEIKSTATKDEIKKAYRKLAKKYHPDTNPGSSDHKFKEINEAYVTLSDPAKKGMYDRRRGFTNGTHKSSFDPFSKDPYGFNDFNSDSYDTFWDWANKHSHKYSHKNKNQQSKHDPKSEVYDHYDNDNFGETSANETYNNTSSSSLPNNLRIELPLEPQEFYQSTVKKIRYTQKIVCDLCEGQGQIFDEGNAWRKTATTCSTCNGFKYHEVSKTITIKIPKGCYIGTIIKYDGLGNKLHWGKEFGDLEIRISKVQATSEIRTYGNDTASELTMTTLESIVGGKYTLRFPKGEKEITFEPLQVINSKKSLDMAAILFENEGVPIGSKNNHTDHIVNITILSPTEEEYDKIKTLIDDPKGD